MIALQSIMWLVIFGYITYKIIHKMEEKWGIR